MTSSKYQIWLEEGKKKRQLPVNPESIKIQRNGNNQSVTIAGLGETKMCIRDRLNRLQTLKPMNRQLRQSRTVNFSSHIPKTEML